MMQERSYRLAGIASILGALLFLPALGLLVLNDLREYPAFSNLGGPLDLLPLAIGLDILSKVLVIYAMFSFKHLLNVRYDFHSVDVLIPLLILLGILLGGVSYGARIAETYAIASLVMGLMLGLAYGIVGIVFALRLLKLNGNLNGYLKPLAYIMMASSVCFVTILMAPLALALEVVFLLILGLVLLSKDQSQEELGFV